MSPAWILAIACVALAALAAGAAAGKAGSGDLERLSNEYWQGYLAVHPTTATAIGDTRYDDRLEDLKPEAITRERARLAGILERAHAFDAASLSPDDRLPLAAPTRECEDAIGVIDCHFEDWVVDPLGGPQIELLNLRDYTTIKTPADGSKYVKRCRAMGPYMDAHIANLARGLAAGRVASRDAVRK